MKLVLIYAIFLITIVRSASAQTQKIDILRRSLPELKDSVKYVDALNRIAVLYYEINIDSTFYYTTLARETALKLNYQQGIADFNNNLGIVYDIKGNSQLALKYYDNAYQLYRDLGDSSNIVQTLSNIAFVYKSDGKPEKAQAQFEEAIRLGTHLSKDSINALVIYNYILAFPDRFNHSEKESSIARATAIARKYDDQKILLAIDQLKADMMIADGDTLAGQRLLERTLNNALNLQFFYLSMDILMDLGNQHIIKNPSKALEFFEKALRISEEKQYPTYSRDISKILYKIYTEKGDHERSAAYSQKLISIYEKLIEVDKKSGIDYLEFNAKEKQLSEQQVRASYNSRMLWMMTFFFMVTVILLVVLFRNWRIVKTSNATLRAQYRQLESATDALEQSNKNYNRLLKVVAHDLRNPIGAIQSLSTILRTGGLSEGEQEEFLQLIETSSKECLVMIGELLKTDFSHSEAQLKKQRFDLSVVLQQLVKLLQFKADEKGQTLKLSQPEHLETVADQEQLARALNNILVNAIKFSPSDSAIEITAKAQSGKILIAIKDYGIGIPEESANKIFDAFTTLKRPGTHGESPFGLGLFITKQIVEAHRGHIWYESLPAKGTTFFIELPLNSEN